MKLNEEIKSQYEESSSPLTNPWVQWYRVMKIDDIHLIIMSQKSFLVILVTGGSPSNISSTIEVLQHDGKPLCKLSELPDLRTSGHTLDGNTLCGGRGYRDDRLVRSWTLKPMEPVRRKWKANSEWEALLKYHLILHFQILLQPKPKVWTRWWSFLWLDFYVKTKN